MPMKLKIEGRLKNAQLQLLREGKTQCLECRNEYPVGGEPLQQHECPQCGAENLTPCNIGKYWLFGLIGGGGMGAVYQAYHEDKGHLIFALKLAPYHSEFQDKMEEALRSEYHVMQALGNHPCIASSHELCEFGDKVFVVMDYISGERLDARIHRLKQLSEVEVALLALRLISAEVHIFRSGYVFRDIKPENVILTAKGAVLYDFGICMARPKALEDPGDLIEGSPLYMPPERLTGEGESIPSEIYSMGMLLYCALSGETLIQGTVNENIAAKHVEESRVTHILKHRPEIHAQWEHILDRMIVRQVQKRYSTFTELERDVMSILGALTKQFGFASLLTAIPDILLPTGTVSSQFQSQEMRAIDEGEVMAAADSAQRHHEILADQGSKDQANEAADTDKAPPIDAIVIEANSSEGEDEAAREPVEEPEEVVTKTDKFTRRKEGAAKEAKTETSDAATTEPGAESKDVEENNAAKESTRAKNSADESASDAIGAEVNTSKEEPGEGKEGEEKGKGSESAATDGKGDHTPRRAPRKAPQKAPSPPKPAPVEHDGKAEVEPEEATRAPEVADREPSALPVKTAPIRRKKQQGKKPEEALRGKHGG
ncbi:MAG TPA: hypothetical protein DCR55_00755 [Lentisphaeria bacterium]|nr:hypothetical protein [Lentisphaeria bacterium]